MKYVVVVERDGEQQAVGPYSTIAHARQHAQAWHGDDGRTCRVMAIMTTYSYVIEHTDAVVRRRATAGVPPPGSPGERGRPEAPRRAPTDGG